MNLFICKFNIITIKLFLKKLYYNVLVKEECLHFKKNVCISTIYDGMFVNVYDKQMYQNVYSVVVK